MSQDQSIAGNDGLVNKADSGALQNGIICEHDGIILPKKFGGVL